MPFIPTDEWSELTTRAEALLGTTHKAFQDSPVGAALVAAVAAEWGEELAADVVILAADALRTPQLLWASGQHRLVIR